MAIVQTESGEFAPTDVGVFFAHHGTDLTPVTDPASYWDTLREPGRELIIADTAEILWASKDKDGAVIDISKREFGGPEILLGFDATNREQGIFSWEIMQTDRNGRAIRRLTIDNGRRTGILLSFDRKNIFGRRTKLSPEEANALAAEIVYLASHELAIENRDRTYRSKIKLEQQIGRYALTGRRYDFSKEPDPPKVVEKEVMRLKKIKAGIGYRSHAFYKTHRERIKQLRQEAQRRTEQAQAS